MIMTIVKSPEPCDAMESGAAGLQLKVAVL